MKQIKIAICDDEEYYREEALKFIEVYANEYSADIKIDCYESGEEFLETGKDYNIVLFDIEMKGIDGVYTAKQFREKSPHAIIVFVTSHEQYALPAYQIEALGYIVKPMKYIDLKKIMDKAITFVYYQTDMEEAQNKYIEVVIGRERMAIDKSKIIYIEKNRNKCTLHTTEGEFSCYETLKDIYSKLNQVKFVMIHQGYIANFQKIKEVKKYEVSMGNGIVLPISRKYYELVKEKHTDKINMLRKEKMMQLQ